MMAVFQGLNTRLNDMLGRAKIRLTDAQIDDVMPFGGKLLRAR